MKTVATAVRHFDKRVKEIGIVEKKVGKFPLRLVLILPS
jgi:hypothetical protein